MAFAAVHRGAKRGVPPCTRRLKVLEDREHNEGDMVCYVHEEEAEIASFPFLHNGLLPMEAGYWGMRRLRAGRTDSEAGKHINKNSSRQQ